MKITNLMTAIALAVVISMMSSCRTQKQGVSNGKPVATTTTLSADKHIEKVKSNNSLQQNLTAKVKFTLDMNGKSVSTSGTLKMKKDDVIQISLVDPILGAMEVGKMEFTKTRVLIIDRINKQYVDVPYSDVAFLQKANIDFNTLQSLFWNEVFQPGKKDVVASDFVMTQTTDGNVELAITDQLLKYNFTTIQSSGLLYKTAVADTKGAGYKMNFDYADFVDFEGRKFPKDMKMSFTSTGQKMSLAFSLSSIHNSSDWVARTQAPAKYTKADAEKIFRSLAQ